MSIRITAGEWGGRVIPTPKHDRIRPTTARMRESMFSQLQYHMEGLRVLDGFSGTGVISLEALSRGASFALAIEKHRPQAMALKQLAVSFHTTAKQFQVVNASYEAIIKKPWTETPFDWVYLDPPYPIITSDKITDWLTPLVTNGWLNTEGHVWLEHPTTIQPPNPDKQKSYGDSTISQWGYASLSQLK